MCKIYKVKYESLACIYRFTGQSDIVHDIQDRRNRFMYNMYTSHNEVVSHLTTLLCSPYIYICYLSTCYRISRWIQVCIITIVHAAKVAHTKIF